MLTNRTGRKIRMETLGPFIGEELSRVLLKPPLTGVVRLNRLTGNYTEMCHLYEGCGAQLSSDLKCHLSTRRIYTMTSLVKKNGPILFTSAHYSHGEISQNVKLSDIGSFLNSLLQQFPFT